MKRGLAGLIVLAALSAASIGGIPFSGAVFTATSVSTQTASAVNDFVPPTINVNPVIAKDGSTTPGFIKENQGYRVYADVTDSGSPASGVNTVTANVGNVTTGSTSVTLTHLVSPVSIGGHDFNYQSDALASDNPLSEGSKSFSVTASDVDGNVSAPGSGSVTVDNTGPTVTSIVAKAPNGPGGGIKASDTYYVFANTTDVSPIDTITADISSISPAETTPTSKPLSTCTGAANCTVGGTLYAYRAGPFTSDGTLVEGPVPYSVTATDLPGNSTQHNDNVQVDNTDPVVTGAVIQKSQGGVAGQVHQGGNYFIFANVTDASQVTVTADVGDISGLANNAVPLAACTGGAANCTVNGVLYAYKSASVAVSNPKTEGVHPFSITATDAAGNDFTQLGFGVNVDNTVPAGATNGITAPNGGTTGQPEEGDSITYTATEQLDPNSILAAWSGTSTNVVVRLVNSGSNDRIDVWNSTNTAQLPIGSVVIGAYIASNGADITYGATGTASTMVQSGSNITVTLGHASGTAGTVTTLPDMTWTPSATATDPAGNAMSNTAKTETDNDNDF